MRKPGERYNSDHIVPTTKWGKGSVMIWSCFWAGGFGPLVFCEGNVDQDAYVDILAKSFMPWFIQLCHDKDTDFILQEDGATCHTGKYAMWWKDTHQIPRLDFWPPQSPDLNPIEHLWSCLEKLIEQKRSQITSIEQLKVSLEEVWGKISVDLAERLVDSMKDRCQAVIDANGGYT